MKPMKPEDRARLVSKHGEDVVSEYETLMAEEFGTEGGLLPAKHARLMQLSSQMFPRAVLPVPDKPQNLPYEDFAKLDIRVGQITKAEAIPKSKKLLKLEVYFGELGTRTILAGIAGSYDLAMLPGQRCVAVLNLAPRRMFDIESHGMLLAGRWADGRVNLVQCDGVAEGGVIG